MGKEPTFPGFTEIQEFWQSALKPGGASAQGGPDMLAGLQAASATWLTHRQEDFGKAVETFGRISACKNPAEAMALQQQWLTESWQRLMADWMALMTPAATTSPRRPPAWTEASMAVKKVPEKTAG
jgi:hypothetical protein